MTQVGTYTISKTANGWTLTSKQGEVVGTFPSARAANAEGVRLTAAAYKAQRA